MNFKLKELHRRSHGNKTLLQVAMLSIASGISIGAIAADSATEIQEISVFGRGETRQVQSLNAEQLTQFPAGTSPLKAIEKLPGVNFQSADPYGAYEWSTRIVVRGFNQNQMGFTLDGVPLGDMSYANHNGLHISRAIMSENIGRVSLSQGAGALATASTSNLGGTLEFSSAAPSETFGVMTNATVGSDGAQRLFLRADSGELSSGTRMFLSVANQETDKWKGSGAQEQKFVNFKLVQSIGEATVTGVYNTSDRAEIDYQDMSKEMISRLGRDWDNYAPDYARAIAVARGTLTGGVKSQDDAYWDAAGLREDNLSYVTLDMPLQDNMEWKTTAYFHDNEGQGLWGTPYVATPGGAPLSIRTTEYEIDRSGLISTLSLEMGAHTLSGGIWTEDNDFNQARRFYGESSSTVPSRSFQDFQRNPFFTQWEYDFTTETLQLHVRDTWRVADALRLELGFKSVEVDVKATTVVGDNKTGKINTDEKFLPQAGFVYDLNERNELFGSFARNVRAFIGSATGTSPFSATQAGFEAIRSTIQPEMSTSMELGWRFRTDVLEGVVTGYHVMFDDRLLAIQQGSAIIGNFNALANVGAVKTTGLESGVNWQLNDMFSWYNSASLNLSTYEDDFTSGTTVIRTGGKTVVDSPEWMFNSELAMETETLFAKLSYKYTGERQYTYLNEGSVSSFGMVNVALGYHFGDLGALKDLTAQLDVTNLMDKDYISTVGSGGFSNSDLAGTAQTILPGAPRQMFMTVKASF
ncbi:MAG: TonB-dependent receptor [Gammaproteobacteria bacterium]|nr:TonB-dependent receptor [Gammaproteobacteria bacterium]